jgi:hypothetical protein
MRVLLEWSAAHARAFDIVIEVRYGTRTVHWHPEVETVRDTEGVKMYFLCQRWRFYRRRKGRDGHDERETFGSRILCELPRFRIRVV